MYRKSHQIMDTVLVSPNEINDLRKRILPVLLYCQANKADLWEYDEKRREAEDAAIKMFYAYYSGVFCRILYKMEYPQDITPFFIHQCNLLLDKYNWYDNQDKDLELFCQSSPRDCEVSHVFEFLDGIDNVAWKDSGFGNGNDAVCLKLERSSWTFADVRGSIMGIIRQPKEEE